MLPRATPSRYGLGDPIKLSVCSRQLLVDRSSRKCRGLDEVVGRHSCVVEALGRETLAPKQLYDLSKGQTIGKFGGQDHRQVVDFAELGVVDESHYRWREAVEVHRGHYNNLSVHDRLLPRSKTLRDGSEFILHAATSDSLGCIE
jgi:hypothetical protein